MICITTAELAASWVHEKREVSQANNFSSISRVETIHRPPDLTGDG
jgi:hypothetical protein